MRRRALFALVFGMAAAAWAAGLTVDLGQTRSVGVGQVYESATVRNGGVLILDGGIISNAAAPAAPSVVVEAGGRFVMNSGAIHYYDNRGVVELYGGRQSTESSENRGYLRVAGGDPGSYLINFGDGVVDIYHAATSRPAWEVSGSGTSGIPAIRFFSVTNTLAPGSYSFATLPTTVYRPGGKEYHDVATNWTPVGLTGQTVTINLDTNWPGKVWVMAYAQPTVITSDIRTAVEVIWKSTSGRVYQVQSTTNLISGPWVSVGLPVHAASNLASVCDPADDTNKVYRIVQRH